MVHEGAATPRYSEWGEHIGPEDTFDGDYGRLLEQAAAPFVNHGHGKCGTSPTGFEPVFWP